MRISTVAVLFGIAFIGVACSAHQSSDIRSYVSDSRPSPLCETAACGIDSDNYTSLRNEDGDPFALGWQDVLGHTFVNRQIALGSRGTCAGQTNPEFVQFDGPRATGEISWTDEMAARTSAAVQVAIQDGIRAFASSMAGRSTNFNVSHSVGATVARDSAREATTGKATVDLFVYRLTESGVRARREACGKGQLVSQVAVQVYDGADAARKIAALVVGKLGVAPSVKDPLSPSLEATIRGNVRSTFARQSVVLSVGWL